jgi:nucleotide-binding universal stress UspA family protein
MMQIKFGPIGSGALASRQTLRELMCIMESTAGSAALWLLIHSRERHAMYKRILIPTDGSEASRRAIGAGIDLAKFMHAEVVALNVTPVFHVLSIQSSQLSETASQFEAEGRRRATHLLHEISVAARAAGVPCTCEHVVSDHPFEAIIATARDRQCDLINMASHGHQGIKGLLLGSQTQKVLGHSTIPVLVHR